MSLESMLISHEHTYGWRIRGPGKVGRKASFARNQFICAAYAEGYTMKQIAALLRLDYTNVYRLLRKETPYERGFHFTKPAEEISPTV
jgi:hypothetical protein